MTRSVFFFSYGPRPWSRINRRAAAVGWVWAIEREKRKETATRLFVGETEWWRIRQSLCDHAQRAIRTVHQQTLAPQYISYFLFLGPTPQGYVCWGWGPKRKKKWGASTSFFSFIDWPLSSLLSSGQSYKSRKERSVRVIAVSLISFPFGLAIISFVLCVEGQSKEKKKETRCDPKLWLNRPNQRLLHNHFGR